MKLEFDGAISIEIPTEDELSSIYDTIKATMQKEDTFELMETIKERTDRMAAAEGLTESFEDWNLVDKITWFVSEAYCAGFISGIETTVEMIAEQVKEGHPETTGAGSPAERGVENV